MPYTLVGKVQYLLGEKSYVIRDSIYLEDVTFVVEVLVSEGETFTKWIQEQTNAGVTITPGEDDFIEVPVEL